MTPEIKEVVLITVPFVIALLIIVAACFGAQLTGHKQGVKEMQEEAVRRGFATWEPDEDGEPEFKWKGDLK